jgi:hypothetical protein
VQNTALPHMHPQKPTHKAQRGCTSAVQSFSATKNKSLRSSFNPKEINKKYTK